ncbi:MAG TPA: DUF6077 domain-containing protein [Mycobacteriales bacterium]|nr:DUF6077 domain-containing protein [Mycobacteriales bacterium]
MTATSSERPAPTAERAPGRTPLVRAVIAAVDGGVVAFAWFTVLAHVWDIANLRVDPLLLVWVLTLPLPLFLVHRLAPGPVADGDERPGWLRRLSTRPRPSRRAVLAFALLVAVAALLLAVPHRVVWRLGWAVALVGLVVGLLALLLSRRSADDDGSAPEHEIVTGPSGRAAAYALLIAVVAGIAFGLFALFAVSPDPDDAYYVNRVTWIAQHGAIPDRDTMFGNNVFPTLYQPAIGTFETFAGGIAHVLGVAGPSVDYMLLGPILAALMPLVLWRCLVGLRVRRPVLGMLVVVAFLVLTSRGPQWFGMMVLRRSWQTKEFFAAAMVPLIYTYAALSAHRRGWRAPALLAAATIAALGFSSSAAGLAPVALVAAGIAGYLACGKRMLAIVGAALAYPIICLAAYRLSGSSSAFSSTSVAHYKISYDIWQWFVGNGVVGFAAGLALVAGFLGARTLAGKLMLGGGSLAVMLTLAPGVLGKAGPLLGGAPTAWRVLWVAPLPLLLALVPSAVDSFGLRIGAPLTRATAPAFAAVLVVLLAVFETPLWSSRNTTFESRPRWDIAPASLSAARHLVRLAPDDAVVAGPTQVSLAAGLTTTRVHPLDARTYYGHLISARAGSSFRMKQRELLTMWLGGAGSRLQPDAAATELRTWPVAAVCLSRSMVHSRRLHRSTALQSAGYTRVGADRSCIYFKLAGS